MADILPNNTLLNEVVEGDNFSISFEPVLTADEKLVKLEIKSDLPKYINIVNDTIYGIFINEFNLGKDSIEYRNILNYGVASSFSEIPAGADIYSFKTPNELKKTFNIDVILTYTELEVENTISKSYLLPLQGNWDSFKKLLKEHINASSII